MVSIRDPHHHLSVSPGYPDPEVVWYKDDQPIKETRHFQIDYDEDGNCSLVISEVRTQICFYALRIQEH